MLTLCVFLVFAFVLSTTVQTFAPVKPVFAPVTAPRCQACGRAWAT